MKSSLDEPAFHHQSGQYRLDRGEPAPGDDSEVDRVGGGLEIRSEPAPRRRRFLAPRELAEEVCEGIIGRSAAMRNVLNQMRQVAPTDATVLICGETGTGKERFARAVHALSARSGRAFVKCNCVAIPTLLLESELFGHEKGAFTGAMARRIGRFEAANGGTLFLDEIGEAPLQMQPKLLRVLQEREFERVGSSRTLTTDVRLVAATNVNLQEMVRANRFRADLFYRLNVIPLCVPPLRERREDIPAFVEHFTRDSAARMRREITTVPPSTMDALMAYSWPGNVRELQNLIERAVVMSTGEVLTVPLAAIEQASPSQRSGQTLQHVERAHHRNPAGHEVGCWPDDEHEDLAPAATRPRVCP